MHRSELGIATAPDPARVYFNSSRIMYSVGCVNRWKRGYVGMKPREGCVWGM